MKDFSFNLYNYIRVCNDTRTKRPREQKSAINSGKHYQINIYDVQGKLVQSHTTSKINNYEINVQALSSGIYNVNVSAENWSRSIKFVKE